MMLKEEMTAKERIGHFKARIYNEIHDPMIDDDKKGMAAVTRSMCRELDNIVRAVREDCAKSVDAVVEARCPKCNSLLHIERSKK